MADKVIKLDLNYLEEGDVSGKIVNIYDSYANAVAHGATGLQTVKDVNELTGVVGSAIPQTAKTAGPTINLNGKLVISLDDGTAEYWARTVAGRDSGPIQISMA